MEALKEDIYFLNVSELKLICYQLGLPDIGKKKDLIQRILIFLKTGKILKEIPIPEISKAKRNISYPLSPDTLILYGNYKNDLATRLFMKTLIGDYFHFTAMGQDWIKECWIKGKPPTYDEFAKFWKQEYEVRKHEKVKPKQEWAYLNFIQHYLKEFPKAKRPQIMESWKITRAMKVQKVQKTVEKYLRHTSAKI